jgi:hypothetical protein
MKTDSQIAIDDFLEFVRIEDWNSFGGGGWREAGTGGACRSAPSGGDVRLVECGAIGFAQFGSKQLQLLDRDLHFALLLLAVCDLHVIDF